MPGVSFALVIVLIAGLGAPILGVVLYWLVEPITTSLAITLVTALFGPIMVLAMYMASVI